MSNFIENMRVHNVKTGRKEQNLLPIQKGKIINFLIIILYLVVYYN